MDKLKNLISPGHNTDDQKLYGEGGQPSTTGSATGTNPVGSSQSGTRTGGPNELDQTASDARRMGGSSNMPGGFDNTPQYESSRELGGSSATHPSSTMNPLSSSNHPGQTSGIGGTTGPTSGSPYDSRTSNAPMHSTEPAGVPTSFSQQPGSTSTHHPTSHATSGVGSRDPSGYSSTAPSSGLGAADDASTTSIKSGVPGSNTHSSAPLGTGAYGTGSNVPSTGGPLSSQGGMGSTGSDPYGTSSSGRLQDPSFSNRTLHSSPNHPSGSSPSSHRRAEEEALAGGAMGTAGYEAARHHGHHGHHGTGSQVPSSGTHGLSGTTGGMPGTSSTGSSHNPLTGSTRGTDPTTPHADVGGTFVDRSFPLGGHAGEGPHQISTANRLDPTVPDTAAEYRSGNHHHGQPHGQHHTGRDAALTGGALGGGVLAADEAHKHHHPHSGQIGTSSGLPGSTGLTGNTSRSNDPYDSTSHSSRNPLSSSTHGSGNPLSSTSGTSDPYSSSSTGRDHHYGRDAALGAGAAGLGAEGAHTARDHHDRNAPTTSSTGPTSSTGGSTMTSGGVGQPSGTKYNTLSDGTPSGIAPHDPAHSSAVPSSGSSGTGHHGSSHLGRDAALGATGAGIGSGAAYEAGRHHGTHGPGSSTTTGGMGNPSGQQYDQLSSGTPSGISSRDPAHGSSMPGERSGNTMSPTSHQGGQHHLGRDAALGAGAGGAAYEAERHLPHRGAQGTTGNSMQSGSVGQPTGRQYNTLGDGTPSGIASTDPSHPQHSSHVPGTSSRSDHSTTTGHGSSGHHYGRDAGLGAAGVGAGGLAAEEYARHRDQPSSGMTGHPSQQTTGSGHSPVAGYQGPQAIPGAGPGHSGTSTAAQRAQDSLSRHPDQTSGHHSSHAGRDAAGAAGLGGAGAAAYEAEKHHHGQGHPSTSTSDQRAQQPLVGGGQQAAHVGTDGPIGTHARGHPGSSNVEQRAQDSLTGHQGSHAGRDTAAAAGVGGAGTAAAYEHEKHKHGNDSPSSSKHDHAEGEKKPGLLDKILHRDPSKKEHEKEQKEMEKQEKKEEKEMAKQEKKEEKQEKKEEKEMAKQEKKEEKEEKKEDKQMAKQDSKHGSSSHGHKGEGAALGGAGAGIAGEEAYRHGDPHTSGRTAKMPGSGVHGQAPFDPQGHNTMGTTGTHQPGMTGAGYDGAGNAAQRHGYGAPTSGQESHLGRDAALGGAGVGGGAYAGDKFGHHGTGATSGYPQQTGSNAPMSGQGYPSTGATAQGIDPRVDSPQYGSSGAAYGSHMPGSTQSSTMHPSQSGYAQQGGPMGTSSTGQSSKMHEDPMMVGGTAASGTRNAPNYATDSPMSGEKQHGGLSGMLHRDNPNKLHKDPPQ